MRQSLLYFLMFFMPLSFVEAQSFDDNPYPFSTNHEQLTIWNGTEYLPFFMKGINLGIATPGTFPGELSATRQEYARWFDQIKDAGFNTIRLYTLHYPRFYEVLDSFNLANPQNPLFIIQGVWLNEEIEGYNQDLHMLNDQFDLEIRDNIDCVHGNIVIPPRFGKAYGDYHTDVSKWTMAYLIGREISPAEILKTDDVHSGVNSFEGDHFAIDEATASEAWYTEKLDLAVGYEQTHYGTQRPISFSSWPTLDPLHHPEEAFRDEDTAAVDLSKLEIRFAPAGFFISYHAYPYYPDFISLQSSYQDYHDNYGPNSYMGYLTELKSHYNGIPLIIAEFGVPSSWGVAHYASSGMNHGGFDEVGQGNTVVRMFKSLETTGCGGGIQFSWMDEWFKRTWVTDHLDFPGDRRIQWHNITAAEQNFGLIGFRKESVFEEIGNFGEDSKIQSIQAGSNYDYFELEIAIKDPLDVPDEMWVAFDTYLHDLGESILPTGDILSHRSEFALQIRNYSATLFVTEAYDLYGIYHHESGPNQLYRSTVTDGAPWNIVRWKNNAGPSDVQYIGSLQLNHSTQSPNSKDAVTIFDDKIKIRIPWTLINFIAPSELSVMHDLEETPEYDEMQTDGIAVSVVYKDDVYSSSNRYLWEGWDAIDVQNDPDLVEVFKTSYWVLKDRLPEFNSKAIAVQDSIYLQGPEFPIEVPEELGVLMNDFDLDGDILIALITESAQHGNVNLSNDGSFTYMPASGFNGYDYFKYCIFDGYSLSVENTVVLSVEGNASDIDELVSGRENEVMVYPNPTSEYVNISASQLMKSIQIFDLSGKMVDQIKMNSKMAKIELNGFPVGEYILLIEADQKIQRKKVIVNR